MKTARHFWSYLAYFFLEWETFHTKIVENIKTHILCSVTFFRKSYRLQDNVEKYRTEPDRPQMTIWRMRIAYVRLHLHTQNMYTYYFQGKIVCMHVPQYYVIRALPVFFRNDLALYHMMYRAQRSGVCASWLDCTAHTCAPCASSPPLINLNPTKSSGFLPSSPSLHIEFQRRSKM